MFVLSPDAAQLPSDPLSTGHVSVNSGFVSSHICEMVVCPGDTEHLPTALVHVSDEHNEQVVVLVAGGQSCL